MPDDLPDNMRRGSKIEQKHHAGNGEDHET
jgi:hypothetical protein